METVTCMTVSILRFDICLNGYTVTAAFNRLT